MYLKENGGRISVALFVLALGLLLVAYEALDYGVGRSGIELLGLGSLQLGAYLRSQYYERNGVKMKPLSRLESFFRNQEVKGQIEGMFYVLVLMKTIEMVMALS